MRVFSDDEIMNGKINHWINFDDTIRKLRQGLSKSQFKLLKQQPVIKNFLMLDKLRWAGQVVHNLVMRLAEPSNPTDKDALWFEVGEDIGRFSIKEFSLITGLKCVGSTFLKPPTVKPSLVKKYFATHQHLTRQTIEEVLTDKDMKFDTDDDAIRLGMLYVLSSIILANGKTVRIPMTYVELVEDIEGFNDYPWGIPAWEMTRDSIRSAISNKGKGKGKFSAMRYTLIGFPHSLLVWAFESIPGIRGSFASGLGENIPRMLSWSSEESVMFVQVKQILIGTKDDEVRLSTTFDINLFLLMMTVYYMLRSLSGHFNYHHSALMW